MNQTKYAQHFTPTGVAQLIASLCRNQGRFLEPACGDGALVNAMIDLGRTEGIAIELDDKIAPTYAVVGDFFTYSVTNKFPSILANPPYLSHKSIPESTRSLSMFQQLQARLGGLANLYHYFILKAYLHLEDNGEMVIICPEEIWRTTSSFPLTNFLHTNGTFSDIIYFKKSPFLPTVTQPVVVFRYQKGDMSHRTNVRVEE